MRGVARTLLVVSCVSALAAGLAGSLHGSAEDARPRRIVATAVPSEPSAPFDSARSRGTNARAARWVGVLRRLDSRRAAAFAHGEPRLLRRVYAAGSAALAADLDVLAAYRARRLRIAVTMTLLQVRVGGAGRHGMVLDVVDRLVAPAVVDRAGRRTELPRDQPTAHTITLVRTPAGWRIAAVRAAKPG